METSGYTMLYLLVATVSLLRVDASAELSEVRTSVACDDETFKLTCPPGKFISIRDGFFGRTSDEHCARGPRLDYKCFYPDFRKVAVDLCSNKAECIIAQEQVPQIAFLTKFPMIKRISNDPCPGTFKYKKVTYDCHDTPVACDDETLKLRCPAGQFIMIRGGFFGRTSDKYCARGPRLDYKCSLPDFKGAAADKCDFKEACDLNGHMMPKDPCEGTFKYMTVEYDCVDVRTAVACDGETAKLQCPPGKHIMVRSGFFGRMSDRYCARGPRLDYKCSLPEFGKIASEKCNNKEVCSVTGDFFPRDPCPGTLKYVDIVFDCFETNLLCNADAQSKTTCPPSSKDCPCELIPRV